MAFFISFVSLTRPRQIFSEQRQEHHLCYFCHRYSKDCQVDGHGFVPIRFPTSIFTARIPKEWGRYSFHRCLSVDISGGGEYPLPADGGTPFLSNGGIPSFPMEIPPSQVRMGDTSIQGQDGSH